jgi:transposase
MDKQSNTKPKNVDYFQVPDDLWTLIELCLPPVSERRGLGRLAADARAVWNGIWYHL